MHRPILLMAVGLSVATSAYADKFSAETELTPDSAAVLRAARAQEGVPEPEPWAPPEPPPASPAYVAPEPIIKQPDAPPGPQETDAEADNAAAPMGYATQPTSESPPTAAPTGAARSIQIEEQPVVFPDNRVKTVEHPPLRKPADPNDWTDVFPLRPAQPVKPNYIVLGGVRYPLPVLNRSIVALGGGYLGRVPYEDAINDRAGSFTVENESVIPLALMIRLRSSDYWYFEANGRYDAGELSYVNGAQRETFDFTNYAYDLRLAGVIPFSPRIELDAFAGMGSFGFTIDDGDLSDIEDTGAIYGAHLTALLRWQIEASIGYRAVATGNDLVDDENGEDAVLRLMFPARSHWRVLLTYSTGLERAYGAFGYAW